MVKRIITKLVEFSITLMFFIVVFFLLFKYLNIESLLANDRYNGNLGDYIVDIKQDQKEKVAIQNYEKFKFNSDNFQNTEMLAKSVPVLLYHGLAKDSTDTDPSDKVFEEHMFALKKAGYHTITIQDFSDFLLNKIELKDKAILITFDDGIVDSYYNADPILKILDFNAVMFIITKYSLGEGTNYYLSRNEVQNMIDTGRWEIQPHGEESHDLQIINSFGDTGHFLSNKLWLPDENRIESDNEYIIRIKEEIKTTKDRLERELGVFVYAFAFPFGDFGQSSINYPEAKSKVLEIVSEVYDFVTVYQFWLTRGFSHNYFADSKPMIKRINVQPTWSGVELVDVLEKGRVKKLPFIFDSFSENDWIISWGDFFNIDRQLSLEASKNTTSAQIVLDGSYLWKDYIFTVMASDFSNHTLSLLARVQDSENYVACNFDEDNLVLSRYKDDTEVFRKKVIVSKKEYEKQNVGISVSGSSVKCYIGDNQIIERDFIDLEPNGGIGLKVWNEFVGKARFLFSDINVKDL